MSFRKKEPGPVASGAIGAATGLALVGGFLLLTQLPAHAQQASNPSASVSGEFERPFGYSYGQEQAAFDANSRDANGNRLILDGRIMTGMDASTFSSATASAQSWSQSTAGAGFTGYSQNQSIGNQLNVITQGNYNTVIVNSTQINNGNQTANGAQTNTGNQTANNQAANNQAANNQAAMSNANRPTSLNGKINLND